MTRKALIIGAGPAGLTAAFELIKQTDIKPLIVEASENIGGISRTINYKGNRIDIGGHRFFSKSDKIMNWWLSVFPVQDEKFIAPLSTDRLMLIRNRLSRIYFLRKFFPYPITLTWETCRKLGFIRLIKIGLSYLKAIILPLKPEDNLEKFFINRFGRELYATFFKDYTEKVWGVPCSAISAEWGGQRIKGLSISKAVTHALRKIFKKDGSIKQSNTETSLIERFMYPKFGPGQLWEEVADIIRKQGGEIIIYKQAVGFEIAGEKIISAVIRDTRTGELETIEADYFISTMAIKDLVASLKTDIPKNIKIISQGLLYRDFITVGLLLDRLKIKNEAKTDLIKDNWIYIQERDVKLGRLQIFNNWSPFMVADPKKIWIGLEYFCTEGDELWNLSDADMAEFAINELCKIDIISKQDVLDQVVIHVPKTYPAYFGTYDQFPVLREYLDRFDNLFLIGRNGMHRYNNQDHSMLSAMAAVDNIKNGISDKSNIWSVNAEKDYHESNEK
jgi:protoporphyrinogen oxidase